jgi:hypothetical protein
VITLLIYRQLTPVCRVCYLPRERHYITVLEMPIHVTFEDGWTVWHVADEKGCCR